MEGKRGRERKVDASSLMCVLHHMCRASLSNVCILCALRRPFRRSARLPRHPRPHLPPFKTALVPTAERCEGRGCGGRPHAAPVPQGGVCRRGRAMGASPAVEKDPHRPQALRLGGDVGAPKRSIWAVPARPAQQ